VLLQCGWGAGYQMFLVRLIGVFVLVALNGFFAAVEFSLVTVRVSRVRQLVAQGNAQARIVEQLLNDLHRVVSGVQVGITLTSLAIGALGEMTFAKLLQQVMPAQGSVRMLLLVHGGRWGSRSSCLAQSMWCLASWCQRASAWRVRGGLRCWWRGRFSGF